MNRQQFTILALVISIAVNLALVGGIGYRMLSLPEARVRPLPPGGAWVLRDLSEERRNELLPLVVSSENEVRAARAELAAFQRRINELIVADELDITALSSAFTELRSANQRYQALSHQQTVSVLERLSADERRLALEFIRRGGPRGPDGSRVPGGLRNPERPPDPPGGQPPGPDGPPPL